MTESELYKALGELTKEKARWRESMDDVASLLSHASLKIKAKALWLLGEMGLNSPDAIEAHVPSIAAFLESSEPLLRERALNALGRIGRGNFDAIAPYWSGLFRLASDEAPQVRLSFIWASENIATNRPDLYAQKMPVFEARLQDPDEKTRMEAPEIFRVLGKRRPEFVMPYVEKLQRMAESDENRVVRIHCQGAIKAATSHPKDARNRA